jgi:hypothetical protein
VGVDRDAVAVVAGKHVGVVGQGQNAFMKGVEEVAGELLGPVGEVRASNAFRRTPKSESAKTAMIFSVIGSIANCTLQPPEKLPNERIIMIAPFLMF